MVALLLTVEVNDPNNLRHRQRIREISSGTFIEHRSFLHLIAVVLADRRLGFIVVKLMDFHVIRMASTKLLD